MSEYTECYECEGAGAEPVARVSVTTLDGEVLETEVYCAGCLAQQGPLAKSASRILAARGLAEHRREAKEAR